VSSASNTAFVILGNQLFPFALIERWRDCRFFMAEDLELCTYARHHKQKIALFLAAMRSHADQLRMHGCDVHYERLDEQDGPTKRTRYETKLARWLDGLAIDALVMFEIEDKFFERRIEAFARKRGLPVEFLPSPMFVTSRAQMDTWLREHRPHMASFYRWQRVRLGLLIEDAEPIGGKWSLDAENRRPLPSDVEPPGVRGSRVTEQVEAVAPLVSRLFPDHPGELDLDRWWLPTTRSQALAHLRGFLRDRFEDFGAYEDALSTRDPFLFHAALSPALNLGLVTPKEVIDRVLDHARSHDVPLNSLEGVVRQIVGWREFIRGIYRRFSERQERENFFGHRRRLTEHWYRGDTGLRPLDDVIQKANTLGWAHHIERLMVVGNLMTLCEIEPGQAHAWFMEMFVDSSDWVMGPNVYGMGLFSDGGIFATKPYICGSNYILKMSDYARPRASDGAVTWAETLDGLYWRFIAKHRGYFENHPRLARTAASLRRLSPDRKRRIFAAAEAFLNRVTR
jgi:deoxyribodipyrimidine photolyase-related protein